MKFLDATVEVDQASSKALVHLHLYFNDDYEIVGHSLSDSEKYGLPTNVKAGEKIVITLDEPHSGVILFNQSDAKDYINEFGAVAFEEKDNSIIVRKKMQDFAGSERWQHLQYLGHTLYLKTEKGWYVSTLEEGEPTNRLAIVDYRLVQTNTLLRYVFGQNTIAAMNSSASRIRNHRKKLRSNEEKTATADENLQKENKALKRENLHLRQTVLKNNKIVFAVVKSMKRFYAKIPEESKRHIEESIDIFPEQSLIDSCRATQEPSRFAFELYRIKEFAKALLKKGKDKIETLKKRYRAEDS